MRGREKEGVFIKKNPRAKEGKGRSATLKRVGGRGHEKNRGMTKARKKDFIACQGRGGQRSTPQSAKNWTAGKPKRGVFEKKPSSPWEKEGVMGVLRAKNKREKRSVEKKKNS